MVGLMLLIGLLAVNFSTARAQNHGIFTVMAGVNDNFVLPTDSTSPSSNLLGWLNSLYTPLLAPLKDFDAPQNNRWVAHTFTGLSDISEATLEIRLRAGTSFLSHNDSVSLTFIGNNQILPPAGSEHWSRRIGTGHGVPGLLPYDWHSTATSPEVDTIMLDLGNLPLAPGQPASASNLIPALNAHGFLDFLLQDDTDVDYIALTVKGKMLICHIPPGNPSAAHTITVSTAAVSTHLNHGDALGACDGTGENNHGGRR